MIDQNVIEGCRQGDREARRLLYQHYAPLMLGVVRRYVGNRETAEDVLHDGFVQLFTKIGDYRGEGSFDGWCRRIFVNMSLNLLRDLKGQDILEPDIGDLPSGRVAGTQPKATEDMAADDLLKAIASLPEGYRTIINLKAVEGYDYGEIAQMLGTSEATCRSQFLRAKARLAATLGLKMRE